MEKKITHATTCVGLKNMEIQCLSCQRKLKLPDNAAGKKIRCPICQSVFQVPAADPLMPVSEPKSSILDLPPDLPPMNTPSEPEQPLLETPQVNVNNLVTSSLKDVARAMTDRDEAMEMVDSIFNMFMERSDSATTEEERQELMGIAQKIFGLQTRFPLLSGIQKTLEACEVALKK